MIKRRSRRHFHSREFRPQKSPYLVITETYILPFLIILGVGLTALFLFKSSFFQVKYLTCHRDSQACHNSFILSELDKYRYLNIFLFPKDQLRSRLLAGDKTLAQVEFKFHLPNRLDVYLTSTTPKVALKLQTKDQQFILIDDHLRPTTITSNIGNLPLLITTQTYHLQLGQVISDRTLATALQAVIKLNRSLNQSFQAKLDGQDLYLSLNHPHLKVRLTTTKSLEAQLTLLQAVLSNAKMLEEGEVKFIDVRFDQPVLKSY